MILKKGTYPGIIVPYEGSCLTTTGEMNRNVTTGTRRKPKGGRQRLKS